LYFEFCDCFSCDYYLYDPSDCKHAIFVDFGEIKKKMDIELVYVIVVIFFSKNGYKVLDDLFKSIQGDLGCNAPTEHATLFTSLIINHDR